MFSRVLVCIGLMIFVGAPLQAQEADQCLPGFVEKEECSDVNVCEKKCVRICSPGFVSAECKQETRRLEIHEGHLRKDKADANCESNKDNTSNKDDTDTECKELLADLEACQSQCIPLVTNGGILSGPTNGAEARNYLLGSFLPNLTNSFLIFAMIISVLVLIVAGFMWIFASGNTELAAKARDTVIWSIIGLSIGVAAYLLVQIIININFFA